MSIHHPAWRERQRQYWTRENAHLWRRPDAERFFRSREAFEQVHGAPALTSEARSQAPNPRALELAWDRYYALRREITELRLDYLRALYLRKYNPNQPRVPAGNPDGGQWTDADGDSPSDSSIAGSGAASAAEPPPQIPEQRPPTARERNRAIKEVAKWLRKFGGPLGKIATIWIEEAHPISKLISIRRNPWRNCNMRSPPRKRDTIFITSSSRRRPHRTAFRGI